MSLSTRNSVDQAWWQRFGSADPALLPDLFDHFAPVLLGVAHRILGHAVEAEEALIDTMVSLRDRPSQLDQRHGPIDTQLINLVRQSALARQRSRLAAHSATPVDRQVTGISLPVATAIAERQQLIGAAVRSLPEGRRQIVELAFFRGLGPNELATFLGRPLPEVQTDLNLALGQLQTLLVHLWGQP